MRTRIRTEVVLSLVVYRRLLVLVIRDRWRYPAADEDVQANGLRGWLL